MNFRLKIETIGICLVFEFVLLSAFVYLSSVLNGRKYWVNQNNLALVYLKSV